MAYLLGLHRAGVTLVIISHNMDELAALCHRLYVIAEGRTVLAGAPGEVFAQLATLRSLGLEAPAATAIAEALAAAGLVTLTQPVYTLDQAEALLLQRLEEARV
jgi:energy-coupling factor transport system ATP-binding protein